MIQLDLCIFKLNLLISFPFSYQFILFAFGLRFMNFISSVISDLGSIGFENRQHWDSLHSVKLLNGLSSFIFEWNCNPWHGLEVSFECCIIFVTGYENNLADLSCFVNFLVPLAEQWGEISAWGAPMSTEVNSYEFKPFEGRGKGLLTIFSDDIFDSWKLIKHFSFFWLD